MKSIFFMTYFHRAGWGGIPPLAPLDPLLEIIDHRPVLGLPLQCTVVNIL